MKHKYIGEIIMEIHLVLRKTLATETAVVAERSLLYQDIMNTEFVGA